MGTRTRPNKGPRTKVAASPLERIEKGRDPRQIIAELGYKAIIDSLPCYLSIQDPSFQIVQTNQTFRNAFGEAIGRKCHEAYKKSPTRCPSCPVWETFQDRKVHMGEESVQLASGETIQMIVYSSPVLDSLGNVAAVMELSADISRVKEIQEELAFLGKSVAVLSHDIKNILEGLQGGAYVVDAAIKDQDQALVEKGWAVVKKNIYEITWLAQNILYFSKKRRPALEPVALGPMVMETAGFLGEKAELLATRLKAFVNPHLPSVSMDSGALRRLLINLISNALEACSRDKQKPSHTVTVRADFYDQRHFLLEVEDDGIGMDDSIRERVFDRFFSTKGADGTGLGLMVVSEVVQEHGGRIEVLSAVNKGSTFRIILPLTSRPHPQTHRQL